MAMNTIVESAATRRPTRTVRRPTGAGRPAPAVGSWTDPSARSRLALVELALLRSGRARFDPISAAEELGQVVPPVIDVSRSSRAVDRSAAGAYRPTGRPRLASRTVGTATARRAPSTSAQLQPARAGRAGRIRLTVLGQIAVVTALAVFVIAAALVTSLGRTAATPTTDGGAQISVSVAPGDTLYSLAERWAPGADPAEVVQTILEANHMTAADAAALQPGQKVLVPVV